MKKQAILFALLAVLVQSTAQAVEYKYRVLNRGVRSSTYTPPGDSSGTGPGAGGALPRVFARWDPNNTGTSYEIQGLTLKYLQVQYGTGSARADIGLSSGKWYWEITRPPGVEYQAIGVVSEEVDTAEGNPFGLNPSELGFRVAYLYQTGWNDIRPDVKNTNFPNGSGDVLGIALDMDSGYLYFYENCSSLPYSIWSGTVGTWYPTVSSAGGALNVTVTANFGESPFRCAPPMGFNAGVWRY
jgi:hypothetical protein